MNLRRITLAALVIFELASAFVLTVAAGGGPGMVLLLAAIFLGVTLPPAMMMWRRAVNWAAIVAGLSLLLSAWLVTQALSDSCNSEACIGLLFAPLLFVPILLPNAVIGVVRFVRRDKSPT